MGFAVLKCIFNCTDGADLIPALVGSITVFPQSIAKPLLKHSVYLDDTEVPVLHTDLAGYFFKEGLVFLFALLVCKGLVPDFLAHLIK